MKRITESFYKVGFELRTVKYQINAISDFQLSRFNSDIQTFNHIQLVIFSKKRFIEM